MSHQIYLLMYFLDNLYFPFVLTLLHLISDHDVPLPQPVVAVLEYAGSVPAARGVTEGPAGGTLVSVMVMGQGCEVVKVLCNRDNSDGVTVTVQQRV